jgi:hypothetical protein
LGGDSFAAARLAAGGLEAREKFNFPGDFRRRHFLGQLADKSRVDDFEGFGNERRKALLSLISTATGHAIADAADEPEEGEEISEEVARDSGVAPVSP